AMRILIQLGLKVMIKGVSTGRAKAGQHQQGGRERWMRRCSSSSNRGNAAWLLLGLNVEVALEVPEHTEWRWAAAAEAGAGAGVGTPCAAVLESQFGDLGHECR
ncbi:hypothetical protein Vretimale_10219, partial [Volvox reticuliferus]